MVCILETRFPLRTAAGMTNKVVFIIRLVTAIRNTAGYAAAAAALHGLAGCQVYYVDASCVRFRARPSDQEFPIVCGEGRAVALVLDLAREYGGIGEGRGRGHVLPLEYINLPAQDVHFRGRGYVGHGRACGKVRFSVRVKVSQRRQRRTEAIEGPLAVNPDEQGGRRSCSVHIDRPGRRSFDDVYASGVAIVVDHGIRSGDCELLFAVAVHVADHGDGLPEARGGAGNRYIRRIDDRGERVSAEKDEDLAACGDDEIICPVAVYVSGSDR